MADYSGAIYLSQAHTSDDDSTDHSPRSAATLCTSGSGGGGGSSKSKTPTSKQLITLDHLHHQQSTPSSSENTGRKRRGRPPGSKNKLKPPIFITRDNDSARKPVILEISAGSDIIDTIIGFAQRNHVGVCMISASGSVSGVTLRHPISHAPAFSLHGPFGLLCLSGSYVASTAFSSPSSKTPQPSTTSSPPCSFGVTLSGAQGQLFGGIVDGKMIAATQVIVVATSFTNPAFHKLPSEDDTDDQHHQETITCGHGAIGGSTESCSTTTGMSISVYGIASPAPLNCLVAPNVMAWAPSSRPY